MRALALGHPEDLDDARAVPAVVGALDDEDAHVREAAATALREIRGADAATHLIEALGHPRPFVRTSVIVAPGRSATCGRSRPSKGRSATWIPRCGARRSSPWPTCGGPSAAPAPA